MYYTLARIVVPCIQYHGTEEQKRELIPPMARGEMVCWQVLTEPQSGSDVANVKTTAIRDGDLLQIDFTAGTITREGDMWTIPPRPPFVGEILQAGGLVGWARQRLGTTSTTEGPP